MVEVEPKALLIHAESFYGGCTSFTETSKKLDSFKFTENSKKLDSFGCIWSSPTDSDPGLNNEFVTFTVSAYKQTVVRLEIETG